MEAKLESALKWIISILNKHHVPFQIAGGFGARLYGSRRPVNDIDIDIPNENFKDILPEIREFITFGPARYRDEKWDLDLITLDYKNQLIDISGAFGAKLYNETSKNWQPYPCQFETAHLIKMFGMDLPVMNPHDLIAYKGLLNGAHQKEDILAMENYIIHSRLN